MQVNKHLAIGFAVAGAGSWFFPGYNGLLPDSGISADTGQIVGAIFTVGAALLWFIKD